MTDRVESMQIDLGELVALRQRVKELEFENAKLADNMNANAEYANAWYGECPSFDQIINGLTHVIRIAILDEREKCAKECDKWSDYWQHPGHEEKKEVAEMCAEDIRMRSNA